MGSDTVEQKVPCAEPFCSTCYPDPPPVPRQYRSPAKAAPASVGEEPFPAPEHTSRDPWPVGFEPPRAARTLQATAEASGWEVSMTYSRGYVPHAATGRPTGLRHTVALRCRHRESGAQLVALTESPTDRLSWSWKSIYVVGPGVPLFAGCSITDAKGFLADRGVVAPSWLQAVRSRESAKTERRRAAPQRRARKEAS